MNSVSTVFKKRWVALVIAGVILVGAVVCLSISVSLMNDLNSAYDNSLRYRDTSDPYWEYPWITNQYFISNTLRDAYVCDLLMNFAIAFFALSILIVVLCFLIPIREKQKDSQTSQVVES